jgi:ornithine carbamoyltransferase
LADYLTIMEYKKDKNLIVSYVGDGNNMTHSWLMLASKLGFEIRVATPKGYEVNQAILEIALNFAKESGAKITITNDPFEACRGANVVTTDVWASMGQEAEAKKRLEDFRGFTVDSNMMSVAQSDAIFLHCLPAHRGEEVSEDVLESSQSVVFDEAENRLHIQKGVIVWLDKHKNKA